jgi:signal transduction histidine kinase
MPLQAAQGYWNTPFYPLLRTLPQHRSDTARLRILVHLVDVVELTEKREREQALPLLNELLRINARVNALDERPYRELRKGVELWLGKRYSQSMDAMKRAVTGFDASKRPIPRLLIDLAPLYNHLNRSQDRLSYFTNKLRHYRLHGPYQNEAACHVVLAGSYRHRGDYNRTISHYLQAADLLRRFYNRMYVNEVVVAGDAYAAWGNPQKALQYLNRGMQLMDSLSVGGLQRVFALRSLSKVHEELHDYSNALRYADLALETSRSDSLDRHLYTAFGLLRKSEVLIRMKRIREAEPLLRRTQHLADSLHIRMSGQPGVFPLDATWAEYYVALGDYARAEQHWRQAYEKATSGQLNALRPQLLQQLIRFYDARREPVKAQHYTRIYLNVTDSMLAAQSPYLIAQYEGERVEQAQLAQIAKLRNEQALQNLRLKQRNRLLTGALLAIAIISVLGGVVYRQLRLNKRMLAELRKTQHELVAAEKWAFVGEVSAGIAHELQNPLNFMKRFAEVSTRMIDGMNQKPGSASPEPVLAEEIMAGLKQNLHEISQHGLRASSIIRDMLEHSRSGRAQREPTDVNALVEQQLKLAYEGQHAREPQVAFEFLLDPELPLCTVAPQDLGRVLLNLFTNALYAVRQRQQTGAPGYVPTIRISTKAQGHTAQIKVWDNGSGMPEAVMQRVFEPFYTTKPIGDGTGLGLSLSHEIITKGHGGALRVQSQEGSWTEFTIELPLSA